MATIATYVCNNCGKEYPFAAGEIDQIKQVMSDAGYDVSLKVLPKYWHAGHDIADEDAKLLEAIRAFHPDFSIPKVCDDCGEPDTQYTLTEVSE